MKTISIVAILLFAFAAWFLANGGFHSWQYQQTVDGIEYKRIRFEKSRTEAGVTYSIGHLAEQVEVDDLIYKGWLHRREDGSVSGGLTAEDATVNGIKVPTDTWVSFDRDGQLASCRFPGGGIMGAVVVFYPSGSLKEFFAPNNVVVQDIPCKGDLFNSIQLHENQRLKQCTLSAPTTVNHRDLAKGGRINLDDDGHLLAK